jgi:RHS repeat-associated protein
VNGTLTKFLLDGDSVVSEVTGATTVNTLQGPLIDQPLARNGRYFSPQHLGSTATLTDGAGSVVQSYLYGPFGDVTASTAESNPFQYAGRENDGTGLYYNRKRYYVPEWGRFLSEDPIGLAGGLNVYVYAGNNPLNATDPSGTDWLDNTSNFAAGWGDALTLGGTRKVRQWLGVDGVVDPGSGYYMAGEIVGTLHQTLLFHEPADLPLGPVSELCFVGGAQVLTKHGCSAPLKRQRGGFSQLHACRIIGRDILAGDLHDLAAGHRDVEEAAHRAAGVGLDPAPARSRKLQTPDPAAFGGAPLPAGAAMLHAGQHPVERLDGGVARLLSGRGRELEQQERRARSIRPERAHPGQVLAGRFPLLQRIALRRPQPPPRRLHRRTQPPQQPRFRLPEG